jgi:branched-chain amino acid transport system ATP-binding protein
VNVLSVENIDVYYGDVQVLWNCSLNVSQGEIVALFGGNNVGKTTTLRAISRLLGLKAGRIVFDGREISRMEAHELTGLGIAHVPEGRHAYPARVRSRRRQTMARMYDLFPVLKERRKSSAGLLSGGQQQMLAIARGLMAEPRLLLLDEPSLGLAPSIVSTLFETITSIRSLGVTILLVEQNLWESLEIADRYYLMETGRVVSSGIPGHLQQNEAFRQAYLGV